MAEEIKTNETPAEQPKDAPKPEQKKSVEQLEAEIARLTALTESQKNSISRANADAAEWKRALREKQTEQERAEAERAEREKAREARLAELEAKDRVNTYTEKLMAAGYDAANAKAMANSLPEGVGDGYFAAQKNFIETQRQALEAAALKNQPGLSVGMPPTADPKKAEMNKIRGYAGLPPLP